MLSCAVGTGTGGGGGIDLTPTFALAWFSRLLDKCRAAILQLADGTLPCVNLDTPKEEGTEGGVTEARGGFAKGRASSRSMAAQMVCILKRYVSLLCDDVCTGLSCVVDVLSYDKCV